MGRCLCFFLRFGFERNSSFHALCSADFIANLRMMNAQLIDCVQDSGSVAFVAMCKCPKEKSVAAAYL